MIREDHGRRIRGLLALADDHRPTRTGREPIEAVYWARRGKGLPAPMQALPLTPQRDWAEFLAPIGKVKAQDAAKLRTAGVTVCPGCRGLAVDDMPRWRRRPVGWNR